ncbi:MAG: glycoside hydrolase family 38 C-terminal domain-containing protein, partial [Limnochordia bacterium]|nr:glycoside hydrolase family 38 C-terminal domain-containing protein [Limnochordia bacterium]
TYFEGNQVGFTDSLIGVEQALPEWLWRLEQLGYEYDLYPMRVQGVHPSGRYIDNTTASLQPSLIAKQWNEKYAYPKIVTATSVDFYEDFRRAYKDQLPVVTGDLSDWWNDGVASSARETSLNRQARTMLPQAETLATLLGLEYPRLTTAYENLVLYHEHTWGSDNALPTNPVQQVIWREKARFAEDAFSTAQQVLQDSVAFLANKVCQNPGEIVVYNGNSQPMSGPVQVLAPKTNVHQVVDLDTHELHRIQWVTDDMFLFVAKEVPPLGYRRYALSDQKHSKEQEFQPVTASQRDGQSVLENDFFRLEVNNVGRVLSFYDKSLKKEWCDEGSSHGLGEYVYVLNQEQPIKTTSVTIEECGPLFATIAVYGQGIHHEEVVRRYSLWADLRQLDVSVELQKAETLNTEAAFVAFPLSIEDGKAAWQIPGAAVRYMQDQLPGSSLDYQSMQYWADISSDKMGLTLASKDAPLVWFNGYNLRQSSIRPLSAGAMTPVSSMYSFVMNNYWHVNYKRSQGGSLLFRYALRPHGGPLDSGEAHTFGSAFENPLQYAWSTKHGAGTPADSLLAFESAGEIVVVTCKLAQDGAGIVLRLVEVSGHGGVCRLGLGKLLPLRAWETSILEQPIDELSLVGHDLFLELLPFEVKTIYIELSR